MVYVCSTCYETTDTVVVIAVEQVRSGDAEAERFQQLCASCFKKKHDKKIEIH